MSQENVEIVRRAFEAWNAWDMGAFRELYDAEVILRTPKGGRSLDPSPAWTDALRAAGMLE